MTSLSFIHSMMDINIFLACRDPMGLENGVIFDHQLTASSELSESHSADNGRLSSSSAWSPEMFAKTPYLQVTMFFFLFYTDQI